MSEATDDVYAEGSLIEGDPELIDYTRLKNQT